MTIRRADRGRRALAVVLAVLTCVGAAGIGAQFHEPVGAHPTDWDERVRALVAFVQRERGHRFEHAVPVYFLSPAEYRRAAQGGTSAEEPTAEQRTSSRRDVAELRALGLIEGDPDLLDAGNELVDSGTLAYYDQETDIVNVRGSELTVGLRVTLVHELTHALQDQLYDVQRLLAGDSESATAARSVLEGDATAVENAYVAQLSASERQAYETERQEAAGEAQSQLDEIPEVLTTLFGLPYALGSAFVDLVDADQGGPALDQIDDVYRRMPETTSELFDPRDYFDDEPARDVDAPKLSGRDPEDDVLGAALLFVMLAERTDPAAAMAAVDTWRGDAYRSAVDDDRVCVRIRIEADGRQLADALEAWAATMPAEAEAEVHARAGGVHVSTCDPGKDVDMGLTGDAATALGYPVGRAQIATAQVSAGLDRDSALCVGDAVVSELTLDDLRAEELTDDLQQRITSLIFDALGRC